MMKRNSFGLVSPQKAPFVIATLFLIFGLIFLCGGWAVGKSIEGAKAYNVSVDVEVIRVDARKRKRKPGDKVNKIRVDQYRPVFQTTTPEGQSVTYESTSWRRPAAYKVGQKVSGFYNTKTGAIETDQTMASKSTGVKLATYLGLAFSILGALGMIFATKFRKRV